MRERYTNQFKAQVVQELLKEEKTLNQLAAEHGIHPNQLPLESDRFGGLAQPVQQGRPGGAGCGRRPRATSL